MSSCAASLAWEEDLATIRTPGIGSGTVVGAGPEDVARMETALPADEPRTPDDLKLAGLNLDLAPSIGADGELEPMESEATGTHL